MTVDRSRFRQFDTELERIGVSNEARRFIVGFDSTEEAIAALRSMPTGLGTDGFFRELTGVGFATWRAEFEQQSGGFGDAS